LFGGPRKADDRHVGQEHVSRGNRARARDASRGRRRRGARRPRRQARRAPRRLAQAASTRAGPRAGVHRSFAPARSAREGAAYLCDRRAMAAHALRQERFRRVGARVAGRRVRAADMSAAFIVAARRTAVVPRDGAFARTEAAELAAAPIRQVLADAALDAGDVDQVILGNALYGGGNPARVAALLAGLPEETAALTIDTQCCAGLDAVAV